jgi:hypothetical protein
MVSQQEIERGCMMAENAPQLMKAHGLAN